MPCLSYVVTIGVYHAFAEISMTRSRHLRDRTRAAKTGTGLRGAQYLSVPTCQWFDKEYSEHYTSWIRSLFLEVDAFLFIVSSATAVYLVFLFCHYVILDIVVSAVDTRKFSYDEQCTMLSSLKNTTTNEDNYAPIFLFLVRKQLKVSSSLRCCNRFCQHIALIRMKRCRVRTHP